MNLTIIWPLSFQVLPINPVDLWNSCNESLIEYTPLLDLHRKKKEGCVVCVVYLFI